MKQDANAEIHLGKMHKNVRLSLWTALVLLAGTVLFLLQPKWFTVRPENADHNRPAKPDVKTVAVTAQTAGRADFPVYLHGLGTVTPLRTVTVQPRVDGELLRVVFEEGQTVRAGDLLAEIDPRPFQAQLLQAEGQLLRDEALLKNAETDLARYRTLLAQDSIAAQQTATQEALVKQYRGTVKTDRGLIADAKLQLGYARIVAPLTGRAGLRLVDAGNIVHAADNTGLVVITQIRPIAVVFTLAEDDLPAVLQRLRSAAELQLQVYDRSGNNKLADGRLLAVDNQIDPATGTVKLKGQFGNENQALFANQFVNVKMLVDTLRAVTIVPAAAIQRGAPGTFVYVVNPDSTVNVRPLRLGPAEGEIVAVLQGLEPGEKVVVDGIDKLHEGARVELISPAADEQEAE
ncbi:MAG: MdtA/MuxA family multidrug efflux RND transporter periplasmic adaptor subunit [Gammaproteobacteria bacterium]